MEDKFHLRHRVRIIQYINEGWSNVIALQQNQVGRLNIKIKFSLLKESQWV